MQESFHSPLPSDGPSGAVLRDPQSYKHVMSLHTATFRFLLYDAILLCPWDKICGVNPRDLEPFNVPAWST